MMVVRIGLAILVLVGAGLSSSALASELRPAANRPDVTEIGDPILISRDLLTRELDRNSEMQSFVERYGWPDYAEVQEVTVSEPLAAYEVRLYYLRRNQQLSYSRVHVSPAFRKFGIRTYDGPIPEEALARILTARGEIEVSSAPEPAPVMAAVDVGVEPPAPSDEGIPAAVLRLEAAADRAALAAEMAERAATAASDSAGRANAVLDKMLVGR